MLDSTGTRQLCYVVNVDAIEPIVGSDNCEAAVIGGWRVMVKKGEFKPGDKAVYFEIDSKVDPENPAFAFLEKKHFAIKTQKYTFGGKGNFISQGLIMRPADLGLEDVAVGDFLTEQLKVTYYVAEDNKRKAANPEDKYKKMAQRHPAIFRKGFVKWLMKRNWGKKLLFLFFGKKREPDTAFPTCFPYIKKSDEERIENMVYILQDKTPYIKTTKIDGTSSLYLLVRKKFDRKEFYVCSRNVRQLTPNQKTYHSDNVYWSVEFKYHIKDFLEDMLNKHPEWSYVALQGETAGVGEDGGKIQGDPHHFGELRFFGYNFIDSEKGRWNSVEAKNLVQQYGIDWVPIVDEAYILPDDLEEFKLSADGECEAVGASGAREGYVYRNTKDPNISFKNVSRLYLLNHS